MRYGFLLGCALALGLLVALPLAGMDGEARGKYFDTEIEVVVSYLASLDNFDWPDEADFYITAELYDHNLNRRDSDETPTRSNTDVWEDDTTFTLSATLAYGEYCYIKLIVMDGDAPFEDAPADVNVNSSMDHVWIGYDIDANEFCYKTMDWSTWYDTETVIQQTGSQSDDPPHDARIRYTVTGDDQQDTTPPSTDYERDPGPPDGNNSWYTQAMELTVFIDDDDYWRNNECHLNVDVGNGYFRAQHTYTANTSDLLPGGEGTVRVRWKGEDPSGNEHVMRSYLIKVDKTAPVITDLTGPSGWLTNDQVTFNWTATDGTGEVSGINWYHYKWGGGNWITTVDTEATFTIGSENQLYGFRLKVEDIAGNTCDVERRQVGLDRTAPTIGDLEGPGGWLDQDTIEFTWQADDGGSGLREYNYRVDDGEIVTISYRRAEFDTPGDGTHNFSVRPVDEAGNVGEWLGMDFYVDRTSPVVSGLAGPAGWVTDPTVTIAWAGTDVGSGILGFDTRLDSGEVGHVNATEATLPTPSDGSHTFSVRAEDNAGHVCDWVSVAFDVDRTPPVMTGLSVPEGWITEGTFEITFEGEDATSGVEEYYLFYRAPLGSVHMPSVCVSPEELETPRDDVYSLYVWAMDVAGNEGKPATATFSVDATAPQVSGAELSSGGLATASTQVVVDVGLLDPGRGSCVASVEAKVGSSAWQSHDLGTPVRAGTTSVMVTLPDAPGVHKAQFRAVDVAGNVGETYEIELTYDPTLEDEFGPSVYDITPTDGSETRERRPTVSAQYSDDMTGGSGVDVGSVTFLLDGVERTSQATVSETGFSYEPASDLSLGEHTCRLSLRDEASAGNEAVKEWTFTIVEALGELESISVEPESVVLEVGQTIELTVVGNYEGGTMYRGLDALLELFGDVGTLSGTNLTATAAGTGSVEASYMGHTAEALVTVVTTSPVASIGISPVQATLRVGDGLFFEASALDADGDPVEGFACTWELDGAIGTLDSRGHLVATVEGEGTVTVSHKNLSASAEVEVLPAERLLPIFTIADIDVEGDLLEVTLSLDGDLPEGAEAMAVIDSGYWRAASVDENGMFTVDISDLEAGVHGLEVMLVAGKELSDEQSGEFTMEEAEVPDEAGFPWAWVLLVVILVAVILVLTAAVLRRRGGA